eukprot:GHUV01041964.1.p1 GENE.GHUV01041964.1~~GHUV01041964.1.p1  ORF type:complete len:154 (-),score=13.08 GHUV01041964.1:577-1038(-)
MPTLLPTMGAMTIHSSKHGLFFCDVLFKCKAVVLVRFLVTWLPACPADACNLYVDLAWFGGGPRCLGHCYCCICWCSCFYVLFTIVHIIFSPELLSKCFLQSCKQQRRENKQASKLVPADVYRGVSGASMLLTARSCKQSGSVLPNCAAITKQ